MSASNLSYYSFVTKLQQRASLREVGVASGLHGEEGRHSLHGDHALRRAACKDVVLELGLQHSSLHGNHGLKGFHPFEPEHAQKEKKADLKGFHHLQIDGLLPRLLVLCPHLPHDTVPDIPDHLHGNELLRLLVLPVLC